MASTASSDERREPKGTVREKWEKPALRRLGANLAESGSTKGTDGAKTSPKKS